MNPAQRHMELVASVGCVICRRLYGRYVAAEVHHVAEGSSKRSDFATVGLCAEHHRGASGLHGAGVKRFCAMYRIPWEREEGLLVLVNEDIARHGCGYSA